MRALILPNGIRKNLKNILSAEITYEYNIDGVQGKKSLKSLNNFYKVLLGINNQSIVSIHPKFTNISFRLYTKQHRWKL